MNVCEKRCIYKFQQFMSINYRDVTMKYMLQLIAEHMKNELREKLIFVTFVIYSEINF